MQLTDYTTLGLTGLRVSPLCLGTMTFGTQWGWGADDEACRQIFDRYIEAGGNFIDTADVYTNGHSEELVGSFIKSRGLRDAMVIATKFSFNTQPGNPNAGGNGRKNIYRALEASLRRLGTDYIDLYYLHCWDTVTPAEETMSTLSDLVREGKIRYYGLSDTPAWYVARVQTLAERNGKERIAALQHEYSLVERTIEREHIPAAQELGIGLCTWAPLSGGLLTGKYTRDGKVAKGDGRLLLPNQTRNRFTERNWRILEGFVDVAGRFDRPLAQVAVNWVATQPGVTSTIIGATSAAQLEDSLAAIALDIPADLRRQLNDISVLEAAHPYSFFTPGMQALLSGGTALRGWRRSYSYEGPTAAPPASQSKK